MASVSTRDHEDIQRWANQHRACPAVVSRTGGMLRFEFDAPPALADVDWDEFFRVFDERGLELIYDDKPGSRFHKFVYPETVAARQPVPRSLRPSRSRPHLTIAHRSAPTPTPDSHPEAGKNSPPPASPGKRKQAASARPSRPLPSAKPASHPESSSRPAARASRPSPTPATASRRRTPAPAAALSTRPAKAAKKPAAKHHRPAASPHSPGRASKSRPRKKAA